jgi:DNA-directed RNA polymerase delta subunit
MNHNLKLFWVGFNTDGKINAMLNGSFSLGRKYALEDIDKHFNGNTKNQTIEFEYINHNE